MNKCHRSDDSENNNIEMLIISYLSLINYTLGIGTALAITKTVYLIELKLLQNHFI